MKEFKATANKGGFQITIVDSDGSHTMYGKLTPYGYKQHFENSDKEYFDELENNYYELEINDKIYDISLILYKIARDIRLERDDE